MASSRSSILRAALAVCVSLATLASAPDALAQRAPRSHTVQDGETLSQIAQRYRVTTSALASRNHLAPPYPLRRGLSLRLPSTAVVPEVATAATPAARATPTPAARPAPAAEARSASRSATRSAPAPRATTRVASRSAPARDAASVRRGGATGRRASRWGTPRRPGVVNLHRIYSDERVTANLRRPGRSVLGVMRRFMRSTSGATHNIDPRLLRTLALVSDHFGGREVEVISGFRPFRRGQWTPHSNHNSGRAIDFRVAGVPRRTLVDYCRTLPNVGCGFYPRSVFIHMDVRGDNAYWVDWSRPGERPRYGRDGQPPPDRHPRAVPAQAAASQASPQPEAPSAPVTAPPGADGEMDEVAHDAPAIRTAPERTEHDDETPETPEAPAAPAAPATP
ncbi:MAG: DUF882 domain-containing protein [Polyangiales bacterium]